MEPVQDEYVAFSVFYALGKQKLDTLKRCLTEEERKVLAKAVMDHFKLCKWQVMHEPQPWHSVRYGSGPESGKSG